MRRVGLVMLPALCAAAALSLVPASAGATTQSASCTKQVLLFPGTSTSCTTSVVSCPSADGLKTCQLTAKGVAAAAVGISVAGKVVSSWTQRDLDANGNEVAPTLSGFDTASCSAALAILGGCTGQTTPRSLSGGAFANDILQAGGSGFCQWTGGPIAALVTVTCTESITY